VVYLCADVSRGSTFTGSCRDALFNLATCHHHNDANINIIQIIAILVINVAIVFGEDVMKKRRQPTFAVMVAEKRYVCLSPGITFKILST
jgi:hypothetical protein